MISTYSKREQEYTSNIDGNVGIKVRTTKKEKQPMNKPKVEVGVS